MVMKVCGNKKRKEDQKRSSIALGILKKYSTLNAIPAMRDTNRTEIRKLIVKPGRLWFPVVLTIHHQQ